MIPSLYIPPLKIVGPIVIQPFGVLAGIAMVLGYFLAMRRIRATGLDTGILRNGIWWILVPGIVAAHWVSQIIYFPAQTLKHPILLLEFWGGLSSFGGFLGGVAGAVVYFRWKRVPLLRYVDALLFGLLPAWIVGRLGCTVIFDHPGRVTDFVLGMADPAGVVRHNLGFYEMLVTVLLTAILYATGKIRPFNAFHTAVMLMLYCPVRFLLDSLRVDDKIYGGLTPGQYASLAMLALGIGLIAHGWAQRARGPLSARDQSPRPE